MFQSIKTGADSFVFYYCPITFFNSNLHSVNSLILKEYFVFINLTINFYKSNLKERIYHRKMEEIKQQYHIYEE